MRERGRRVRDKGRSTARLREEGEGEREEDGGEALVGMKGEG